MPEHEDNAVTENSQGMEEATPSEEGVSDGTQSDRGSTTYPYRTQLEDASFPRCHLINTPKAGTETYTRSLFMLGHGIPVWEPVGDLNRPKPSLDSGIMIGDVGFITHEGDFVCYFNIFLPAEHPSQRRCPPDLVPLHPPPEASDIAINSMYFPPGTALVSKGVTASVHSSSPLDISFRVKARESGILLLPDGASREDLISTTRIRDYVQRHALEWYVFLNGNSDRIPFPNGSIYVVTGHDKATTWAISTSGSRIGSRASEPKTTRYQNHRWIKATRGMGAKLSNVDEGNGKCALFIRGMRVAVSIRDWTSCILCDQPPSIIHFYNVLAVPVTGLRARFHTFKERRKSYKDSSVICQARERIFHLMEVILRVLLEESPSSDVAFAEDLMWCGVADNSDCSLPQIIKLVTRVLETHEIFSDNGECNIDPDVRLFAHFGSIGMVTLVPILDNSQGTSLSSLNRILHMPSLVSQKYRSLRRRRQILSKISKVFPGPEVPDEMLRRRR